MKMFYEIPLQLDAGKAIPAIEELLDSLNTTLAEYGCDEKLKCLASIGSIDVTVDRTLTELEKEKIMKVIKDQFANSDSIKHGVLIGNICRKSVTSKSSVQ